MIPTEVQRIVLLIGLVATGYLMILAWNADYGPQVQPVEISEAPSVSASDGSPTSNPDVPGPSALPAASDVPDVSIVAPPAEVEAAEPSAAQAVTQRLIRIETDSLHVWVDLNGGDIVRVQLPRHGMTIDRPDVPFLLLDSGDGHTYVAQSGLIGPDGPDGTGHRPHFSSTRSEYELTGERLEVVLHGRSGPAELTKRFVFHRGEYVVDVSYDVVNEGTDPFRASLFAQIKRDDQKPYGSSSFRLGPQPYLGAALTTDEERYRKLKFDELDEGDFRTDVHGGWIAMLQHYFLSAWVPDADQLNRYFGRKRPDGTYIVGVVTPQREVAAGGTGVYHARFYAGPKDQSALEKISPNLNLTVDYGFLWWLAVPLFHVLSWLHAALGNWGVAIILLTVMVKLILYPLSAASFRSMANMKRVAPQMKRLQERHADDRQKLSQEMMALYKKEKVNPLGGCLPMLLPMPVFLALYWVLFESVELRHAPFLFWIHDLSAMDPFFVLPLLMGGTMYAQQLLSPAMGDPMQVRMMRLMPIMFTVLFLFFPAGLVLYWFVNSLLSVAQQWYVTQQVQRAGAT